MRLCVLSLCVLMAGCQLNNTRMTSAEEGMPELPQQWQQHTAGSTVSTQWWQNFGSQELSGLVDLATRQSFDIRSAIARIRQAEAAVTIAGAELWPNVSGQLNASQRGNLNHSEDNRSFGTGLSASYEVDLWGGLEAEQRAAMANLEYSRFDRDAIALSLAANVARQWLQWVGNQERLQIANNNLDIAEHLLDIIRFQHEVGKSSELDVVRQQREVAGQKRVIASLEQEIQQSRVALNILLGETQNVALTTDNLSDLTVPEVGAGVPSDLLFRRPDIAQAEASLQAAEADIDVARAAMLPRVTLSADLGAGGDSADNILRDPVYGLLSGLTAPIFNHGALAARLDSAQAARESLLAQYYKAIVAAVGDTQDALFAIHGVDEQLQAQQIQLQLAREAYDLSEMRYIEGADSLTTLLQSQRDLFNAEDANVSLRLLSLQTRVDLYRALGGGWQS